MSHIIKDALSGKFYRVRHEDEIDPAQLQEELNELQAKVDELNALLTPAQPAVPTEPAQQEQPQPLVPTDPNATAFQGQEVPPAVPEAPVDQPQVQPQPEAQPEPTMMPPLQ